MPGSMRVAARHLMKPTTSSMQLWYVGRRSGVAYRHMLCGHLLGWEAGSLPKAVHRKHCRPTCLVK